MSTAAVPGRITLAADHPAHPYAVRCYRGARLAAYAIRDAFGWAVVARVDGVLATVDRFDPASPAEPEAVVRLAAVRGLVDRVLGQLDATVDGAW